jgi:excisionase family DNA binding protein
MVFDFTNGTICRKSGSACGLAFPEKRRKPGKTEEIAGRVVFSGCEICSEHRRACREFPAGFGEQSPRAAREGAGSKLKETGKMADSREVMNINQASQYLGVSADTLYKYVGEQKIPAFKLGNRWRFKKSKLDQWMEEKSSEMEMQSKRNSKAAGKAAGSL